MFYFKWQHRDKQYGASFFPEASKKWHFFGLLMRVVVVLTPIGLKFYPSTYSDAILALAICAPLYDIGINVFALKQPIFYPGSTSDFDKKFGKIKWVSYFVFLVCSILLKVFYAKF